ncbi:MAG: hypothetical protein COV73_03240 [Candidatus Omnitrophica bacterium CG11_big_fil_rev_8_21_14_0_20_43_6]|nr:MAG: hypothetical protein COV73_03240 [Candidatus Omnitrophica bacterium CG11_big_fil_rev_8_21_14_0_20_43_6]
MACRIRSELDLKVIIVGRSENRLEISDKIIDMVNQTTLTELAALSKRGSLVVSGDSGPMHLAAAVCTPVIALFRNDLLSKTAKRWGPWGQGHTVIERPDLNDITVNEVFNQVKEVLNR